MPLSRFLLLIGLVALAPLAPAQGVDPGPAPGQGQVPNPTPSSDVANGAVATS